MSFETLVGQNNTQDVGGSFQSWVRVGREPPPVRIFNYESTFLGKYLFRKVLGRLIKKSEVKEVQHLDVEELRHVCVPHRAKLKVTVFIL